MSSKRAPKHGKKILIAVGAGVAVAAVALASAAGLGGLTVDSIGAETTVVAAPFEDGVSVTWGEPVYDTSADGYIVNDFTVARDGGENLPAGKYRVTVSSADGTSLGEATAETTIADASEIDFTLETSIAAKSIENVSVVLHDVVAIP